MKKSIVLLFAVFVATMAFGQAKKPTLMVVPSDVWCNQNGYVLEYDNLGTIEVIPDYKKALQNDMNLKLAIAKINDLMAERGFPLKDLEQTLKMIAQATAEDAVTTNKSGAQMEESPLDKIRRTAKADIIIELTWNITKQGPKSILTYVMEAKDAYTGKSIGGANGTGAPSFSAEPVVLLEEAVVANIDNFNNRLMAHFEDLFANGREVALEIRVFENDLDLDLESEFDGMELAEIIEEWMEENTMQGRFSKMDASEYVIRYEQVRIPLWKPNGAAMDTESFARQLRSVLRKEPYNIPVKIMNRGLGKTILAIGGK